MQTGNDGIHLYTRQDDYNYRHERIDSPLLPLLKATLNHFPSLLPHSPDFSGGMIGWLAYNATQNRTHPKQHAPDFPLACFGFYDAFISLQATGEAVITAATSELLSALHAAVTTSKTGHAQPFQLNAAFNALTPAADYAHNFQRIQHYLHAGDCYQVNLAQAFKAPCRGNSLNAFLALDSISRPPHAAYAATPFGDILCLSPELFLRFDGNRVVTRPIKGTRPRSADPAEDAALLQELSLHPKDRAENLMIVDLLRNDLSQHAVTGSVRADELFRIESFAHVHHMISEISCQLHPDSHPLDLLFDAFPGGSITGAPKKRAMEIIDELENCERSIYCGTMGWLSADGRGEWNIAIRTLLRVKNEIYAWAGGGIVADSECEAEYQECFNKIGPLLKELERRFLKPG